jgi:hypothetical protein
MATNPAQDLQLLETLLANSQAAEPIQGIEEDAETIQVFTNFAWIESKGRSRRAGLPLAAVRDDLLDLTGGWPKRVGEVLFVEGPEHKPLYLDNPTKLFAWLDDRCQVDWWAGTDAVSQERFYAALAMTADAYRAVEEFPHWPAMPDTYYMHPPLPETDGSYLNALVNYFCPLQHADPALIRAFILSLFWGGEPGTRPAWLVVGPENDFQKGRGVGKSTLIVVLSELVGGFLEITPTEDIVAIKKRLLSPEARPFRVCRIDNIKTHRFSWADLEGLITSPVISGHRMYAGEGRRPNSLIWTLTLNGASMSKDMAQRCVVIKLNRPAPNPTWEKDVGDYIKEHRWQIIADVMQVLQA